MQNDELLYNVSKVFKNDRRNLSSFLKRTNEYKKNSKAYKDFFTHLRIVECVHQFNFSSSLKRDLISFFKSQKLSKAALKLAEKNFEVLEKFSNAALNSVEKIKDFLSLNDVQLERLRQLADAQLVDDYDFDALKQYAFKTERRNLMNL